MTWWIVGAFVLSIHLSGSLVPKMVSEEDDFDDVIVDPIIVEMDESTKGW